MYYFYTSADFDGENQEEPAIATVERLTPQSQSEFPEEEPAENNPGLIDGISQGGHHSFEPAPASSFLPEPTPVETERVYESASINDDTEIGSGKLVSAVCCSSVVFA